MRKFLQSRLLSRYGSIVVLLLLCAYYSMVTLSEQNPVDEKAGRELARSILKSHGRQVSVLTVVRDTEADRIFAQSILRELESAGADILPTVFGQPLQARAALVRIGMQGRRLDVIATHYAAAQWGPLQSEQRQALAHRFPSLSGVLVRKPPSYLWPTFLTRENVLNVINQNADVAIIAIGMTMVIVTAGIDLSVGSVLALSGVVTAVTIQSLSEGGDASWAVLLMGGLTGLLLCVLLGTSSGLLITYFRLPAFVVTLGMMMVARGLALIIAVNYQSSLTSGGTEGTPEAVKIESSSFGWLGNGDLLGVPNPILLMAALYILAHLAMTRTSFGRYIYAVGGNTEAARLSGVPVYGILIAVYAICGAMAGLTGIVDASRFEGGRPNAGELYELQVIAAVVVGGASLAGGAGRVLGTLVGALIIAVIQNGLNMAGVKSYEQKVIFGLLILAAVLLDRLKHRAPG